MVSFQPHEDECTEFKRELTDALEKEVVAFLNSTKGGDIYIGVEDDGTVAGVAAPGKLQLKIVDRIRNNIEPTALGFFDVVTREIEGKPVIHIVVTRGTEKPYFIRKYGMSPAGAYIRIGTGKQQMSRGMIQRLYSARARNALGSIPSPRKKLSFNQLKIYYEEKGFTIRNSFLGNLDLYSPDNKFNYAAYLLADQNSVSIKVAKYAGADKVELIENEEYGYCSLVKATERVLDKLAIENKTFTKITGAARRLQKNMINKTALREAFINAMVHNDYTQEVTPVVEIFSDRLTITSYGGLPPGLSREEFFAGRSMIRNRELMRVYRDLDLVEQLGSGMNRVLDAYSKDVFRFSENFLEVCFKYDEGYLNALKEKEKAGIKDATKAGIKDRQKSGIKDATKGGIKDSMKTGAKGGLKGDAGKKSGIKDAQKGGIKDHKKSGIKDTAKDGIKEVQKILEICHEIPAITIIEISEQTEIPIRSVQRNIRKLKADGLLRRVGGRKEGYWKVLGE